MKRTPTIFPEIWIVEPEVFKDDRGFFLESYTHEKFVELFKDLEYNWQFVQDNHASSQKNTIRGLHFQMYPGQVKLIRCTVGKIWDVMVDIRPKSPSFKRWFGVELTAKNFRQVIIPVGFAHGYSVISKLAEVQYKVNTYYNPEIELEVFWNDPTLKIDWKIQDPILSERDKKAPLVDDFLKKYPNPFEKT